MLFLLLVLSIRKHRIQTICLNFIRKHSILSTKDTSGKYVDGFAQQEMKEALQRLQTAVNDGVIDRESVNNSTANARDKFYSTDPSTETGVFTYWAGTWANTLKTNLANKGLGR